MIVGCLASHYKAAYPDGLASIKSLPAADRTVPEGPLVYSIEAVCPFTLLTFVILHSREALRALNYSKTGKLIVPGERLGDFSKTNWGDRTTMRDGERITINTTSGLTAYVKQLTDKQ